MKDYEYFPESQPTADNVQPRVKAGGLPQRKIIVIRKQND